MVGFPLLLIPLAVYNIIVWLMPTVSLSEPVLKLMLMSGAEWPITLGDMLLAFAAVMLLLEIVKGARPGAKYLTDHLLSLIVFGAAAAEFLLWPKFGTSIFFLLTLFALVDFLAGVSLRRRRYATAGVAAAPAARKSARRAERSGARAGPCSARSSAVGCCGCRIRAARSPRAIDGAAGRALAGHPAGQWRASAAGRAAALNSHSVSNEVGTGSRQENASRNRAR
jgi:hypothetical protein